MDSFSKEYIDDLLLRFNRTKRYRTYDLIVVNGEPHFVRSAFEIAFEDALNSAFGGGKEEHR
jgi:hypothetical protein